MSASLPHVRAHDLGGRDVQDPEQIAASLYGVARETFAINHVPDELVKDLSLLRQMGTDFKEFAEKIIDQLNRKRGYSS